MSLQFKKLRPLKSYQHVVDEIQDAICGGSIREGERLPSEMKLTQLFDTSRGTIREALRVLEQKGLVSVKTGVKGGARVQAPTTKPMQESVELLIRQQQVSLSHLAEFRTMMEGHVARQAAGQATETDIETLKEILEKARAHIRTNPTGWETFHKMDARFHRVLARIAGNPLIEANLATIHGNIQAYFKQYLPWSRELLDENFQDLCDIVGAVEEKDPDSAGRLAEKHVSRFNRLMEDQSHD